VKGPYAIALPSAARLADGKEPLIDVHAAKLDPEINKSENSIRAIYLFIG
jgi:hypothetical protein